MQLNILYPSPYAVSMLLVVVEMIVECLIDNDLSDDNGDPRVELSQSPTFDGTALKPLTRR